MGRKQKEPNAAAPESPQVITVQQESSETKKTRYVVVRDGHRVSAHEYTNPQDPKALEELRFWKMVEGEHSWGASVSIVEYDNKLHRIW